MMGKFPEVVMNFNWLVPNSTGSSATNRWFFLDIASKSSKNTGALAGNHKDKDNESSLLMELDFVIHRPGS